jgi:Tol biopolymer transport system component
MNKKKSARLIFLIVGLVVITPLLLLLGFVHPAAGQNGDWRKIEFETTEVTSAEVTVSPDGQWLVFTMLGHLFRLPVEGGTAEQLSFGPYYDTEPVFSPDGTRVAFVSDRDGTEGNIFVLELKTGQLAQVTHEPSTGQLSWNPVAGRPSWTPDGQAIVYLHFVHDLPGRLSFWHEVPALVRRVSLSGGKPETLSASPRLFRSAVCLPDGRLAWMVLELEIKTSRIEVMSPQGKVSTLRTLSGYADHLVVSPAGDGLYCDRRHPRSSSFRDVLFVPLSGGTAREIVPVSRRWVWDPQFAVAADNKSLYLGEDGRLWKIALPDGARELIPFSARVMLEIQDLVPPPRWTPPTAGSSVPPRSILHPRLSPDGRTLVFGAAGYVWQQRLEGGQAQRLFEGGGIQWEPAFSPDGRQLAFVQVEYDKEEVRMFDFESGQTRTLASGPVLRFPNWSPDGQRLLFLERGRDRRRVVAMNLKDGEKEKLSARGWPDSRPHFSADGQSLYYSGPPIPGTLYRLPLEAKAGPEAVTQVTRFLSNALVSPDGKWLAFRRNSEIWVAPLGTEPVKEEHVRQLSPEGGRSFTFTPDGSALVYAAGNRVWLHPLEVGEREEIPIRLELQRPTPPPVLLRRVRVLDFSSGGFGEETSLFIEQGRIRWIGSEGGHELPGETVIVDGGGRFAVPGLIDTVTHSVQSFAAYQQAFLVYGVTSVRDVGSWFPRVKALADHSQATNQPVPRYFFQGQTFSRADFRWNTNPLWIYDEEDARTYVRRLKERQAKFIKAWPYLSWPLRRATAEEAHRLGLPLEGHVRYIEGATKSVTLGYAHLEHMPNSDRLYDDVLQMFAAAGTRWSPTLTAAYGTALLLRDEPERLREPRFRAFTPEWWSGWALASGRFKRAVDKSVRGYWMEKLASIHAAHRRGVKLQVGTNAPNADIFIGVSVHWEMEFFVQSGIPPVDVLRIATKEGAAAVGAGDHLGTIEPGKLADIVLLDKNPLKDVKNTQTIWRVIKGGWVFDPERFKPETSERSKK